MPVIINRLPLKWQIVCNLLIANLRFGKNIKNGDFTSSETACTFRSMDISQSVKFINNCFNSIKQYSGYERKDFVGKKILEVGHGENVGVALKFIASGASHVVCLDKFYAIRNREQEYKIYEGLRNSLEHEDEISRFNSAMHLDGNQFELKNDSITCHYGVDIAQAHNLFPLNSFDLIYSNAVLEHVGQPETGLYAMDKLLKSGGSMVHIIDFKDHGMFSSYNMHPLTFLTIPSFLYRLMTSESGQPNRFYPDFYRNMMIRLGYQSKLYICQVVTDITSERAVKKQLLPNKFIDENSGVVALKEYKEEIEKDIDYSDEDLATVYNIKPFLCGRFRAMSDQDLLTAAVLLVSKKNV